MVFVKFPYKTSKMLLQSDSPTGLESAQWTEAIDHVGLIHVTDMFYQCLIAIEQAYKSLLGGNGDESVN